MTRGRRRLVHRRRSGTTVLELVVALVVTGAIAAAGAAAFRQTIDRRTQLLTRSTETERAAAVRGLLREWLSSATLAWPPDATGLRFSTTAVTPLGGPGEPLRLYIDDDDATSERGLTLERRATPQRAATRREIDAAITAMTVEYLDGDTQRWTGGDDASDTRPLAVRVTFPASDPRDDLGGRSDERLRHLPLTIVLSGTPAPALPLESAPVTSPRGQERAP